MKQYSILRPDDSGKPDDMAITCDSVHIERMDYGRWWIGIYRGSKRVALYLGSKAAINMLITEDDLGLEDDRPVNQR